jgi:hypothetical protein
VLQALIWASYHYPSPAATAAASHLPYNPTKNYAAEPFLPHCCCLFLPQAINFWLGSVVMHIWEAVNKAGAEELGPTVGAGLLVGDGLWAIPSSLLAIAGKAPPLCLGFFDGLGCKLPYCAGVWRGGSKDGPF